MADPSALPPHARPRKALALLSGGLDSMLAARLILDQQIPVEGIHFLTGFLTDGPPANRSRSAFPKAKPDYPQSVAKQLGIPLHRVDVTEEYANIVTNPRYGYGANINPCLDCKIFLLRQALNWMANHGFAFLITGDVLGQRPMSQRKEKLPLIETESGASDLLLRPLCAQLLDPTLPERCGWVDRSQLLGISGRSRKTQLAVARRYQLKFHAQPAGGCCLLTEPRYAQRLHDLLNHQSNPAVPYTRDQIDLLRVGRHFRLADDCKLIVARNGEESEWMEQFRDRYAWVEPVSHGGPLVLIDGSDDHHHRLIAARIAARYSQGRHCARVIVAQGAPNQTCTEHPVIPFAADELSTTWSI